MRHVMYIHILEQWKGFGIYMQNTSEQKTLNEIYAV
jgi:hypothetical protein